ncbi:fatty acid--CoA ligase family protein [Streptomonospora sp. S1-112]|uniref:Fatty acid--CoA ligase family protein n=1 Tax=Streptomonospora mangrovi TaxID=2883123 RepID=A0A9X3NRG8_9ACTN|nr:fatty acid--CoA ligase family protein [Streptomonospora mangrovi]MDA0567820.1 fatty acid--CoA ligase family protein [Streptomonospora mangrovi]
MTSSWTSKNGVVLTDLVPAELRRSWVDRGYCPDRDLYSLFAERVRAHPRRDAVIDSEGVLDYAALDERVRRTAAVLAGAGIGAGDIVAIQLPNGRRAAVAELAVAAVGAVSLPYPAMRGRLGITALLRRSRASAVITGGAADTPGDPAVSATATATDAPDGPGAADLAGAAAGVIDLCRDLTHPVAVFTFGAAPPGAVSVDDPLAGTGDPVASGRAWRPAAVDPESPARILVTSGSEAEPKMIAYSHNAMAGGRGNYVAALHDGSVPMRNLVLVPLASSYGSLGVPVTLARLGGTLIVLDGFDPRAALRAVGAHRPTHLFAVPTMLRRITDLPRLPDEDTSSLRAVVTSSAVIEADVIAAARERFGRPVLNVYGSADGMNCHTPLGGTALPGGVTGPPDPAVAEIRVAGTDGRPLPPGEEGEIWARGPMSPLCYVNAPDLDARYRAPGGWVRSGDRGRLEPDGALRVVDRIKRVVKRGGYSISPREVEALLARHPDVAEAVCVPVPDPDLGERLCACVVPRAGAGPVALPGLTAFLEQECGLERAKLPERLLVLSELPLGATGKVCLPTLAALAAAGPPPEPAAGPPPEPAAAAPAHAGGQR